MEELARAETIDGYRGKCSSCPLNFLSRKNHVYLPWMDQSLALQFQQPGEKIVIMNPTAEGGMPHTRPPNIIAIPAYFPPNKMESTLKHERMHLHQRNYPSIWEARARADGWTKVNELAIPAALLRRTRLNPDTCWSRFWAWEGEWVPLALFLREDKPELHEIVIRWYNLKSGTSTSAIPSSFTRKYGSLSPSAMEHPFELWAYN